MVIFNSYVRLPEGNPINFPRPLQETDDLFGSLSQGELQAGSVVQLPSRGYPGFSLVVGNATIIPFVSGWEPYINHQDHGMAPKKLEKNYSSCNCIALNKSGIALNIEFDIKDVPNIVRNGMPASDMSRCKPL